MNDWQKGVLYYFMNIWENAHIENYPKVLFNKIFCNLVSDLSEENKDKQAMKMSCFTMAYAFFLEFKDKNSSDVFDIVKEMLTEQREPLSFNYCQDIVLKWTDQHMQLYETLQKEKERESERKQIKEKLISIANKEEEIKKLKEENNALKETIEEKRRIEEQERDINKKKEEEDKHRKKENEKIGCFLLIIIIVAYSLVFSFVDSEEGIFAAGIVLAVYACAVVKKFL